MFNIIDEIDSVTMESELDVLLSMLSLYNKAMIISENYKSTEECESLPFSIFQESSVIMESKSESIFKKLIRIIKETFKKIVESIKKIFKKSSKKEDIVKIKENAKSAVEDYNQHKDKSKIAKLAAKIGLTVVAVGGTGFVLYNKNKKKKVIEVNVKEKKPSKNNNHSSEKVTPPTIPSSNNNKKKVNEPPVNEKKVATQKNGEKVGNKIEETISSNVNTDNNADTTVKIAFDIELFKECSDIIENASVTGIGTAKRANSEKVRKTIQKLKAYNESTVSDNSKNKMVDINDIDNIVDKIENCYEQFKDITGISVISPRLNENYDLATEFSVQFEKYITTMAADVKQLKDLVDFLGNNKLFQTSDRNEFERSDEIMRKIGEMLSNDIQPNEGNSSITAYPLVETRTYRQDFPMLALGPDFIRKQLKRNKRYIAAIQSSALPSNFDCGDPRVRNGEMLPVFGIMPNGYCMLCYTFISIYVARKLGVPIKEVTKNIDGKDIRIKGEYFRDEGHRVINVPYAGYIVKYDDIIKHGIPVINRRMCFDLYMKYQKEHYYDTITGDAVSDPVTLKAIK